MATRLAPTVSPDSEFFWNGVRDHKLLIQRCKRCQTLRQPARPVEGIDLDGEPTPFPPGDPPHPSDVLSEELDQISRDRIYEEAVSAAAAIS